MSFSSQIYSREIVIDDGTNHNVYLPPVGMSRGLELGRRSTAYGQIPGADTFPDELLIPESDWEGWIKEKEERKNRHSDIVVAHDLPCKDQNGTNYCWINAPVYCVEAIRVFQGHKVVLLSPASCGGPIKGFRNDGGWGEEGLRYIAEHGIVPVEYWPANAIDRKYWTETNKKIALDYRVTEWWELQPRNLKQLVSCLLRNFPVALGYNWWGHEVTGADAVWVDNAIAIRIRNSWAMSWGEKGFGILQGSKMLPDDAVVPRVAIAA